MTNNDTVLALDLSSRVGWAVGRMSEDRPRSGVWVLAGPSDLGRTYAAFENMLLDAITVHEPAVMVVEAAIAGGRTGGTNQLVTEQQIGLLATVRNAGYRRDVRVVTKAASSMRKEVIGTGRFPEGQAKKIIMGWLRERGFSFVDDNAADALVAWLWAKKEWGRI